MPPLIGLPAKFFLWERLAVRENWARDALPDIAWRFMMIPSFQKEAQN